MRSAHALIVDDEEELVSTLVERLELRGFEAVGVRNGDEALGRVRAGPVDVVVLDVKLRGEDGVEVMKRIKALRPTLPVILLTGHMSQESSAEGLRAGAIDYIIKPVDIDVLVQKMREAIALFEPADDPA